MAVFTVLPAPSHAYLGLSPGLDFETQLFSKPNSAKPPGGGAAKACLSL